MKRITKEELINFIDSFDHTPTARELTNTYNNKVQENLLSITELIDQEYFNTLLKAKTVSIELMQKYINEYGLRDKVKMYNHSIEWYEKHSD